MLTWYADAVANDEVEDLHPTTAGQAANLLHEAGLITLTSDPQVQRGIRDAKRGKPPIFRRTAHHGIQPTICDDMSDNWDDWERSQYLEGYEGELDRQREAGGIIRQ
jgi:hypothetical protein